MSEPMSIEAELLAALGIDKGKMLGLTRDGLRVEHDPGGARITVELVGRFDEATANRLLSIVHRTDNRCKATMSPGQGQMVRCFHDVGHEGRHHAYDLSWIDGDGDARLENWCPVR